MSERCERMSVRTSEWLSTLRVDFIIILPIDIVRRKKKWAQREALVSDEDDLTVMRLQSPTRRADVEDIV